jgi:hypothetical protein
MLGIKFIPLALHVLPLRPASRSITYEKISSRGTHLFIDYLTSADKKPITARVTFNIIPIDLERNLENADMAQAVKVVGNVIQKFVGNTHSAYFSVYQNNKQHVQNITRDPLLEEGLLADVLAINYYKEA